MAEIRERCRVGTCSGVAADSSRIAQRRSCRTIAFGRQARRPAGIHVGGGAAACAVTGQAHRARRLEGRMILRWPPVKAIAGLTLAATWGNGDGCERERRGLALRRGELRVWIGNWSATSSEKISPRRGTGLRGVRLRAVT